MPHTPRIGIQIGPDDPFWVQVREVMWQRAQSLDVELIEIAIQEAHLLSIDAQAEVVEDLIVQELDALICNTYPSSLLARILDHNIPLIYISEIALRHPCFTSRLGLYDAAHMLGRFLDQRLAGSGALLIVGGLADGEDNGQSRLDGFLAALPSAGQYAIHHVPSYWSSEDVRPRVAALLDTYPNLHIDAIFGLSDSLALPARDACQALGRIDSRTLILGINGDPLALAAIAEGRMTATIETDVDDIATQALDLAYRATCGEQQPQHFQNDQRLVTFDNVAEVAMRKLISLASLPTRLMDVNRRNEQQRVVQLETNLAIDRQVGLILDEQQLALAIIALIRDTYGFEHARFLIWRQDAGTLVEVGERRAGAVADSAFDPSGPLAYALNQNQAVFIPDTHASRRFARDPLWPRMRARVVAPVHLGGQIVGLLDLHQHHAAHLTREELHALQLLADRIGISLRNAELYGQELAARVIAEKADRLKTGLLANVSHELRTPLNVILGYSRTAIESLVGGPARDAALSRDMTQIHRNGEHLLRLINDLLDLSRAEIDELDLLPETIDTGAFLADVFRSSADTFGAGERVAWRLDLPPDLPPIVADPVRLRQVLLNLLHNARKFTQQGQIVLGAALTPPNLHIWVADTGAGIPSGMHEQIFDPFISVDSRARRHEGIGLGLSIARRLVGLHRGRMALESQPDHGSTFHIYLPLPTPNELSAPLKAGRQRALLLVSDVARPPAELVQLAERRGLVLHQLRPGDDLTGMLATTHPALLTWDLADAIADSGGFMQQIRTHPQLAQLPIMLYQHESGLTVPNTTGIATGLLLKPLSDGALIAAIDNFGPREPAGSILIVEDDPQVRDLHHRIIAEHFPDYSIHDLAGGRDTLDILTRVTPSLVVLDLLMPDVDGFAVLEALRASPRTAAVPVLVLSGRTLTADDIRRLGEARVIFQAKDVLLEHELAESLRRTLVRDDALPPHTSALVKRAIAFIQQRYDDPLSLQEIADAVGLSKDYLGRIFHQELGLSPWEYLIRYRVLRAKELLRMTDYSIAEVAARVGFDTATYFSHIFHREVGCSPRAFRARIAM